MIAGVIVQPHIFIKAELFFMIRAVVADLKPITSGVVAVVCDGPAVAWFVFLAPDQGEQD
jgi:hypothetical protein